MQGLWPPKLNAFVVLFGPVGTDESIAGRVIALDMSTAKSSDKPWCTLNVQIGPNEQVACEVPPWRLQHCHWQPPEADDSDAWRDVRAAIAVAMSFTPDRKPKRETV